MTARGAATLIEDPCAVRKVLERTVAAYEPPDSDWTMRNLHENYVRSMAAGVVAFEIPIRSLEGKFKLNQNRSAADQRQVIERLESGDANAKAVAQLMRSGKDTSVA